MTHPTHPLVSVGVPVFNEEKHLRATLDSLLRQTYPALEIVVSDNASTDGTANICREYAAKDPRVRYHRQPENLGASANFNRALELSRGEFFHWAAGHDDHPPELIERCVGVLRTDPTLALCYTPARWEDGEDASGCVDTHGQADPFARLGVTLWGIRGGAVYGVYRTKYLKSTFAIERVVGSDILLLAELSVLGGFARLPEPVLTLRQGQGYGDWRVYVEKIFGEVPADARRLYWRALARLCHRTARHFRLRGKVLAYALAAPAFWARFRWMREGLRGLDASLPSESGASSPAATSFKRAA